MRINAKCFGILGMFFCVNFSMPSVAENSEEAEFAAFLKQQQSEFNQFEQQQKKEFDAFVSAWRDAQNTYLKQVNKKWQDPSLPSSKVWVEYSEDLNTRTSVNFERGEVVVELLNSQNDQQAVKYANQQLTALSQVSVANTLAKDPVYIAANHTIRSNSNMDMVATHSKCGFRYSSVKTSMKST